MKLLDIRKNYIRIEMDWVHSDSKWEILYSNGIGDMDEYDTKSYMPVRRAIAIMYGIALPYKPIYIIDNLADLSMDGSPYPIDIIYKETLI